MTWAPCIHCGADGYVLRLGTGYKCTCPRCGAVLAEGPTFTLAVMAYTRAYRIRRAVP